MYYSGQWHRVALDLQALLATKWLGGTLEAVDGRAFPAGGGSKWTGSN
jgi:hypothetical protein